MTVVLRPEDGTLNPKPYESSSLRPSKDHKTLIQPSKKPYSLIAYSPMVPHEAVVKALNPKPYSTILVKQSIF